MSVRELWTHSMWRCELLPGGMLRLFHWDSLMAEQHVQTESDAREIADRWQTAIRAHENIAPPR